VASAIICESPYQPLFLQRQYGSGGNEEFIQIWEGDYKTGTLILERNGVGADGSTVTYEVCVKSVLHTAVLGNTYDCDWIADVGMRRLGQRIRSFC